MNTLGSADVVNYHPAVESEKSPSVQARKEINVLFQAEP
jgi:hypothetical protein